MSATIPPIDQGQRFDVGETELGVPLDEEQRPRLAIYPGVRDAVHVKHLKENLEAVQTWLAEWEPKIIQGIYPHADKGWKPILGTRTQAEHWENFIASQKMRVEQLQRAIEGCA